MIDDSDCPVDVSVVRCDDRSVAVAATVFRRKNLDLESDFRKFGTVPMLRSLIRILRFFCKLIRKWPRNTLNNDIQQYAVKLALDDMPQDVYQY